MLQSAQEKINNKGVGFSFGALRKPFFCLAPMEGATDTVFRQIIAKIGKPDIFYTEFVNVEGLCSKGSDVVAQRLKLSDTERPIIAQIWGLKPENFLIASKKVKDMGFDGIDINMGCPEKKVVKTGACSALINNPNLAKEIIHATREGAGDLPVSVKTRIGFKKIVTEEWCGFLLEQKIDALTVHGRTVSEMSNFEAHWDEIAKVVNIRNQGKYKTVIIGNGDVKDISDAQQKLKIADVDGIMIGRGVFENPWCFTNHIGTKEEKLSLLKDHLKLWQDTWGDQKNFAELKRFFKVYIKGFDGASELREKLMNCKNEKEVLSILRS